MLEAGEQTGVVVQSVEPLLSVNGALGWIPNTTSSESGDVHLYPSAREVKAGMAGVYGSRVSSGISETLAHSCSSNT